MIPKIIHQTWKNNIIPDNWKDAVSSCKLILADYEYILWTDEMMETFVKKYYSNFYPIYMSYEYNIQRCDVFRYLVLYKYGGIYIDMDIKCKKKLDYLLKYDIVLAKSSNIRKSFTNSFFMVKPYHPFIKFAINNLHANMNKFKLLGKHFHIMNSTGPQYLNHMVDSYKASINNSYILSNDEFAGDCTVCNEDKCNGGTLFTHIRGSTWHSYDSMIYNSILCNYKTIIIIVLFIILLRIYKKGGGFATQRRYRFKWQSPLPLFIKK